MAILGILDEHQVHGYELKKRMSELGGVSYGSLYPALNRLARGGYVRALDEPKPRPSSTFTGPMTGAITGELAAHRRRANAETPAAKRADRRNRKVYDITDKGRARLRELLASADPSDDRSFGLQVAFCVQLPAAERIELFERRRTHLTAELGPRAAPPDRTDPYLRSLHEHTTNTLNRDLEWIDELVALTRAELSDPDTRPPSTEAVPATGGTSQP
ncbi:MAG: helix-turn-helix transcriptional regulator [Actinobacteria bacterium]|nr:helix-turn-helix transcriptional regulator [Actinomycetota bacterium]